MNECEHEEICSFSSAPKASEHIAVLRSDLLCDGLIEMPPQIVAAVRVRVAGDHCCKGVRPRASGDSLQ